MSEYVDTDRGLAVAMMRTRGSALLMFLAGIPGPSCYVLAQEAPLALRACVLENDDARRLACYDAQMKRPPAAIRADAGATPGSQSSPPQARFGMTDELERRQGVQPQPAERLNATITSLTFKTRGELVIGLDNGQTWEEVGGDTQAALKSGEAVTISRGIFGSYLLYTSKSTGVRVRRVR